MVDFTGGTWRSLIDGTEIVAIPDSAILQWRFAEGSETNTTEELGTFGDQDGTLSDADMWDDNANKEGGWWLENTGSNNVVTGQWGNFGSTVLDENQWGIGFTLATQETDQRTIIDVSNNDDDTFMEFEINRISNRVNTAIADSTNTANNRVVMDLDVNDGTTRRLFMRMTGDEPEDIEWWADGEEQSTSIDRNEGQHGTFTDFDTDVKFFDGRFGPMVGFLDHPIVYDNPSTDDIQKDYDIQPWS